MDDGKAPTWLDLVREVFPDASEEAADYILWSHTGYPGFWHGDPTEECRRQLREYRDRIDAAKGV